MLGKKYIPAYFGNWLPTGFVKYSYNNCHKSSFTQSPPNTNMVQVSCTICHSKLKSYTWQGHSVLTSSKKSHFRRKNLRAIWKSTAAISHKIVFEDIIALSAVVLDSGQVASRKQDWKNVFTRYIQACILTKWTTTKYSRDGESVITCSRG